MFSFSLSHSLRQDQKQDLRMDMKQMQLLRQELREPAMLNALRGVEGVRVAHRMLVARQSVGLLMGGIARAMWNRRGTEGRLRERKDVDVLV